MDDRPGVHAVSDFMAKIQCLIKKALCLCRGAVPPSPGGPHVGKSKATIDQVCDVLGIGRVEPPEFPKDERAQARPITEGRGRRAKRLQRLPHEFFDIRLPSRNTDHNSGAVQRCQSVLPAGKPVLNCEWIVSSSVASPRS